MIYTVGLKADYDFGLHDSQFRRVDFVKQGPHGTYAGGIVFKTVEDGISFLAETGNLGTYAVYGVEADWNNDTVPDKSPMKPYHRLQRDAKITQLRRAH